jgi:ribosomal protein S18 acetylase RimI-like enzyme
LATTSADGAVILRTLNGVALDGWVLFHGAVAGEKNEALGRSAVVAATETVAQIPSSFVDPQLACPATTYFRSVQAKGPLLEMGDEQRKREMLEALMLKYQPEGGYRSFLPGPQGDNDGGVYRKELRSVRVIGVRVEQISGKENLGKDRPPERTRLVVEGLWKRGAAGDLTAIETILAASPDARPGFLRHAEWSLSVSPTADFAQQHAELLTDQYWRQGVARDAIVRSIFGSTAWVGAVDANGKLWGAARAATDGAWVGRICDVIVMPKARGRGLGRALMTTLLDHPAVRQVTTLSLGTRDRGRFYDSWGFEIVATNPEGMAEMRRRAAVTPPA